MAIITVNGLANPGDLGFTLMHEHIFIDLRFYVERSNSVFPQGAQFPVCGRPLRMSDLGEARRNMFGFRDNLVLSDLELAIQEVGYFREVGGGALVDVTPWGMGGKPDWLKVVSQKTGINIVASCGYYQRETYPPYVEEEPLTVLADRMVNAIADGAGVRAGMIGEIAASPDPDAVEKKVYQAVAVAHRNTGAPIIVHPCPPERAGAIALLDLFEKQRVDLTKVIISHVDINPIDWAYLTAILERGANIEFDNFGHEHPRDWRLAYPPTDWERIEAVSEVIARGYIGQVFISTDVCLKMLLRAYGGWGYAHLPRNLRPYFRKAGLQESQLDQIFKANPARVLDFWPD